MNSFVYSRHKTLEKALARLEDFYATGEVFPCELHKIGRDSSGNYTIELKG
jgi:hypothetical protein